MSIKTVAKRPDPSSADKENTISTHSAKIEGWWPQALAASLAGMKVREILRLLRKDGWREIGRRGSHRQLKHPSKSGRVTVPGKPGDNLAPGTLASILKQAQLKKR